MSKKNIIQLLPEFLRTSTQKKFFKSTIEQLFSSSDRISMNGYIGRRDGGYYDPLKDYFIPQPSYERMWNLLEPIALSRQIELDGTSNETFLEDLLNHISFAGGNVSNRDRLFKSEYYSFAPPINIDKFLNYASYIWKPNVVGLGVEIHGAGFTDAYIENNIIGSANFSLQLIFANDVFNGFLSQVEYDAFLDNCIEFSIDYRETVLDFTNDFLLSFADSTSYVELLQVCGVGSAEGIILPKRYPFGVGIDDPVLTQGQDFTTVEFGYRNLNEWSINNFWYHRDTMAYMASVNTTVDYYVGNAQARRPIISFIRDLELFGHGTEAPRDVDFATGKNFNELSVLNYASSPYMDGSGGVTTLADANTLVYTGSPADIIFNTKESFVGRETPYAFTAKLSFETEPSVFAVVNRPLTMPFLAYAEFVLDAPLPPGGLSFNGAYSSAFGALSISNGYLPASVVPGYPEYYDIQVYSPYNGGNPITGLDDENIYLKELRDDDGYIDPIEYKVVSVVNSIIRIKMLVPPTGSLSCNVRVITGSEVIIDPAWYALNPYQNIISFKVDAPINDAETHPMTQVGPAGTYKVTLTNISVPEYVTVYKNGVTVPVEEYTWSINELTQQLTVVFADELPSMLDGISTKVTDGVMGLYDGQFLAPAEFDTVDIYVDASIEKFEKSSTFSDDLVPVPLRLFSFETGISDLNMDDIIAIKVTDQNEENVLAYNFIIDTVVIDGSSVNIRLSDDTDYSTDKLLLYVRKTRTQAVSFGAYIWESNIRPTVNLAINPGYSTQLIQLPVDGLLLPALSGDTAAIISGDSMGKSFYHVSGVWAPELHYVGDVNHRSGTNVPPKFELYFTNLDENGDGVRISSLSDSFIGSEIFSYKVNQYGGYNDPYLNFPLEYKDIGVNSEIVFEHDLEINRYMYSSDVAVTEIPGYYYFKSVNAARDISYDYTWANTGEQTKLRINNKFVYLTGDHATAVYSSPIGTITAIEFDAAAVPVGVPGNYDVKALHQGKKLEQGGAFVPNNLTTELPWNFHYDAAQRKFIVYVNSEVSEYDVFEFKIFSADGFADSAEGNYAQPQQLENNAEAKEITEVTIGELAAHFKSIIENQYGFEGEPFGYYNNYRDTAQEINKGDVIIQTSAPLLRAMLGVSEDYLSVIDALNFSKLEYVRYKDKIVKIASQLTKESWDPRNGALLPNTSAREQFFDEIISRISMSSEFNGAFENSKMLPWGTSYVNDLFTIDIVPHVVPDGINLNDPSTMICLLSNGILLVNGVDYDIVSDNQVMLYGAFGTEAILKVYNDLIAAKVPSTTAKCGMTPVFIPALILDSTTYADPQWVIVGHDGSRTIAYSQADDIESHVELGTDSLDLRDSMLLEFETRIYNNISATNKSYLEILPKHEFVAGFARTTPYSKSEIDDITATDFVKWAYKVSADYETNATIDLNNWKTWNYATANPDFPGSWRGIYLYLYDTLTPNTTPWEMLGFSIKPTWWDSTYGVPVDGIYSPPVNVDPKPWDAMWIDLMGGRIVAGDRIGVDPLFIRPHLKNNDVWALPIDGHGLIAPHLLGSHIGIVESIDADKSAEWKYGDMSPVEFAWYSSSEYNYTFSEKMFLMAPNRYCEYLWGRNATIQAPISPTQVLSSTTLKRNHVSDATVHGENGSLSWGYQQMVADRMRFLGADVTRLFGNVIRNASVNLAHRVAGYINKPNIRATLDGSSYSSNNSGLVIPDNSYSVKVHTGKKIGEFTYSGVMIRKSETGYQVFGYDYTNPEFKFFGRSQTKTPTQIDVGGKPSPFRSFKTGETYSNGTYVRYNAKFYQSMVNQTVNKFEDGTWNRLAQLPSIGGKSVSYIKQYDVEAEYVIAYNTVFSDDQSLFDFLIGYGDWLTYRGWKFDNVDEATGKIQNWLEVAKQVLFWGTSDWGVGNTIQVSAGSERINLEVAFGYPSNIGVTTNGIYSVMDSSGAPIFPKDMYVEREGQHISIGHNDQSTGVYFAKVVTSATEHIIVFDNRTDFNDVIYNPLFSTRVRRIELRGTKSDNWSGLYEADGFILDGDSLVSNFENITDSTRRYYDVDYTVDNPIIENSARHLIGFENKSYYNALGIYDDAQYQFYKGMLPEKGTSQPFSKLMRSSRIVDESGFNVYENWAFKVGEFGNFNNSTSLETVIDGDEIFSDPQLVKLTYGSVRTTEKVIQSVQINNATNVYSYRPVVKAATVVGNSYVINPLAEFEVEMNGSKRITAVNVLTPDVTFTETPVLLAYDIPRHQDSNNPFDILGYLTADILTPNMAPPISRGTTNSVINIDINDKTKWISDNSTRVNSGLFPVVAAPDIRKVTKDAGYVHLDDINYTSFDIAGLSAATANFSGALNGAIVWVAEVNSANGRDWDVYSLIEDNGFEFNSLAGTIVVDGIFYTYEPSNATSIPAITNLIDSSGTSTGVGIADGQIDLSTTENLFFVSSRFKTVAAAAEVRYVPDAHENGVLFTRLWVDYDALFAGWAVYERNPSDNPAVNDDEYVAVRWVGKLINSSWFGDAYIYDMHSDSTLNHVPIFDPYKGIIPVVADRNLTYISDTDPSKYTVSATASLVSNMLSFTKANVGELWWDTSTAKYVLYEQGTDEYRRNKWGTMFPGSIVNVYEWVISDVMPSDYSGEGTPKNTTDYVIVEEYDPVYEKHTKWYMFWVKDLITKPNNVAKRNLSAKNVARLLTSPRTQGYAWYAVVSESGYIFNNVNASLNQTDNVFKMDYRFSENEDTKHVEWKLIGKNNPEDVIPDFLMRKLVDSLSSHDANGNPIPDPRLYFNAAFGIKNVPRQSMFSDVYAARKIMMESLNALLSNIRLRDNPEWLDADPLGVSQYEIWGWRDWYADGYDASNTVPRVITNYAPPTIYREIPPIPTLTPAQWEILRDGDIVQSFYPGNSIYFKVQGSGLEGVLTDVVRRGDTELYVTDNVYSEKIIEAFNAEIRFMIETILSDVFTLSALGDYSKYKNEFFFAMVNYVAATQKNVDWFFKTTYLDLVQGNKALDLDSLYLNFNKLEGVTDFFNEIKPYQSKIKDVVESYSTVNDAAHLLGGDFDSYMYDTTDDGKTVKAINPTFNPYDLVRQVSIDNIYDSVQCGFEDKDMYVETGGQEYVVPTVVPAEIIFSIAPVNFKILVNGIVIDEVNYAATVLVGNRLSLTFNTPLLAGDVVFVQEFWSTTGAGTYTFLTYPQIDKLSFTVKSVGVLGDDMSSTYHLRRGQGFTVTGDNNHYNKITVTIAPTVVLPAGLELIPSGGIYFTHTAIEEMRLSCLTTKSISNIGAKLVEFDFYIDADGQYLGGWGAAAWSIGGYDLAAMRLIPDYLIPESVGWDSNVNTWDSDVWNFAGSELGRTGLPNTIRRGKFIVESGAAGRFIKMYDSTAKSVIRGDINENSTIKYSEYSEKSMGTSPEETELLAVANSQYGDAFACSYQGLMIDAKDFEYLNSNRWDSEPWDSDTWDGYRTMPFVTPNIESLASLTFIPDGVVTEFNVPSLVTVLGVTIDGTVIDEADYVVSQDIIEGVTYIEFGYTPDPLVPIEVFFNKDYNVMTFVGDGAGITYNIPYRAVVIGVDSNGAPITVGPQYTTLIGAGYTSVLFAAPPLSSETISVAHKRLFDVYFTGNNSNYIYIIVNADAVGEITVDGVLQVEGTDYAVADSVNPVYGNITDLQIEFIVPPAAATSIRISHSKHSILFDNDASKLTVDGGSFTKMTDDEGVTDEVVPLVTTDTLVITYADISESTGPDDVRIFVSDTEQMTLHDITYRTLSVEEFAIGDISLKIADTSIFPDATLTAPKPVWIGSERMLYTSKDSDYLHGVRRMTSGTTLGTDTSSMFNLVYTYPIGSYVYPEIKIPV